MPSLDAQQTDDLHGYLKGCLLQYEPRIAGLAIEITDSPKPETLQSVRAMSYPEIIAFVRALKDLHSRRTCDAARGNHEAYTIMRNADAELFDKVVWPAVERALSGKAALDAQTPRNQSQI